MKLEILDLKEIKNQNLIFSELQKHIIFKKNNNFKIFKEKNIPIILSLKFFYILIKNYFVMYNKVSLKKSIFFISALQIVQPKIIVTFRTFSKIFIDIDRYGKFNCLTIQNTLLPLYGEDKIGEIKYRDLYCSNIMFFGKYFSNYYIKKSNIKNSTQIGALNLSRYLNSKKRFFTNKYDICLPSVFRPHNHKLNKSWKIFLRELSNIATKKNYKIAVCSRYIEKERFKKEIEKEKKFFKRYLKKFNFIERSEYSTYETIDNSNLTISTYNTTLFESIARGKKTMFFDYLNIEYNYPGFKQSNGIKFFQDNIKTLEKDLENLMKMNEKEFLFKTLNFRKKICSTDKNLYHKFFESKIYL